MLNKYSINIIIIIKLTSKYRKLNIRENLTIIVFLWSVSIFGTFLKILEGLAAMCLKSQYFIGNAALRPWYSQSKISMYVSSFLLCFFLKQWDITLPQFPRLCLPKSIFSVLIIMHKRAFLTKWMPYTPNSWPAHHSDAQDLSCMYLHLISL